MEDVTGAAARGEPVLQPNALNAIVEMIGVDDPEVVVDLIDTFLTDSQRQVEEMQRSIASGDIKTLHRAAHSMKSSSATFGAMYLSKLCQRLEQSAKDQCGDGTCAAQIDGVVAEHGLVMAALAVERAKFAG
jgi:HPt (histidine-containing phosphotransfer) domain-containing protein